VVTAAAGRRPDRRIRCVISRVSAAAAHRPLAKANGCLLTGRVRNDAGSATGRQNSRDFADYFANSISAAQQHGVQSAANG